MKYAHLEENTNKLLGWYDDNIHSDIPKPNIGVEDDVWQDALSINANCYENKKFIVKDFRTDEEVEKEELQKRLRESQFLLDSTEYKFNEDYDKKHTPEWEELRLKRADARKFIRDNK